MDKKHWFLICILVLLGVFVKAQSIALAVGNAASGDGCGSTMPFCFISQPNGQTEAIGGITMPKIATPAWLSAQQQAAPNTPQPSGVQQVAYSVATRGNVSANVDEFKATILSTLNSPNGWSRMGVRFNEVASGGQFTFWLSEASQMTTFSANGCDTYASCRVGTNVIFNQDRWLGGSTAWNNAGGSLGGYRQMVINHEVGHWLGHGHRSCQGAGQPAPVMQQQTLDMQGCAPNSWPLAGELYSSTLGIRS